MAETANIAKMAEILSQDLFAEFHWQKTGPMNVNWPCDHPEAHNAQSHPSDVVFYYDEPYVHARTYVNCDLKSYAKGTITTGAIRSAIESLSRALRCAETSEDFRLKYLHENKSPQICGLLFVYNHDGEYDRDFGGVLEQVKVEKLDIPTKSKIVVLGPKDIFWLNNVRLAIAHIRGAEGFLPEREQCKYFYPHLVRRNNVQLGDAKACTLEMLTAPWIILSYTNGKKGNRKGYLIFYRKRGESTEEFLYLIDYLMHYQVLIEDTDVHIRTIDPDLHAPTFFEKAKTQYAEKCGGGAPIKALLDAIQFKQTNAMMQKFSELELGM